TALHGVEAEGRQLDTLDEPGVGAVGAPDHPRDAVAEAGGNMLDEVVREGLRLDDVVVDAHEDEIVGAHGALLLAGRGGWAGWSGDAGETSAPADGQRGQEAAVRPEGLA